MLARPFAEIHVFTISAGRARSSAEIRVVEVQKLWTFYDFYGARTTLYGNSRGRGSITEDSLRFLLAARDPLRKSCASKRSRCGVVRICLSLGEPFAEIVRVEAFSLWRRAIPGSSKVCFFCALSRQSAFWLKKRFCSMRAFPIDACFSCLDLC